jgi:hypothetical protein
MYVELTFRLVLTSFFCTEKAISITYSECVSVALAFLEEIHVRHIAICSLPRSTTLFHINS